MRRASPAAYEASGLRLPDVGDPPPAVGVAADLHHHVDQLGQEPADIGHLRAGPADVLLELAMQRLMRALGADRAHEAGDA